jgi:Plasmid pRiA4b ORF-3-like protein
MERQVYFFAATLVGVPGVRRTIAVRSDQTLAHLHDALRGAFGWDDDHLYSFWLDGKFWSRAGDEYTHPWLAAEPGPLAAFGLGPEPQSAEVRLDGLELTRGKRIAYVFDFGDEWRVRLTVQRITADDGGAYPRLVKSVGDAPPQYPDYEEFEDVA